MKTTKTVKIPLILQCHACGQNSLREVWVISTTGGKFGYECTAEGCGKEYVLYFNAGFGLRPASLPPLEMGPCGGGGGAA
ncbi:MAG TPA: hypothetical protein VLH15_04260 [Dehalococcoidales bacterium]|nr:hypothetical protein [Dehalococcoidales bacterium]